MHEKPKILNKLVIFICMRSEHFRSHVLFVQSFFVELCYDVTFLLARQAGAAKKEAPNKRPLASIDMSVSITSGSSSSATSAFSLQGGGRRGGTQMAEQNNG